MIRKLLFYLIVLTLAGRFIPAYSQQQVNVQVFYDSFGQECSWQIINKLTNAVILSGSPGTSSSYNYNQTFPFQPGEYEFQAFDSQGDGWDQGGWYAITPSQGIPTGVIEFLTGFSQSTEFTVFSSSAIEIGVVAWVNPVSSPGLTATQPITVKVRNYGTTSLSNFTLSYSINGGFSSVNEIYNGILTPGNVLSYTFFQPANMGSTGQYSCIATVSITNDVYAANNSLSKTVTHVASISNFPWTEQFTSFPPSQWTLSGNNNWMGYENTAAYCNFFAWENASATLITPPINLNQATSLSFAWSSFLNEFSLNDKLTVQISTDNQATWTNLWEKQGNELFSNDGSSILAPGSYITETIDLSSFINNLVYIKFLGTNTNYSSNLYLDFVKIIGNSINDLRVLDLAYPASASCGLQSAETIQVNVKNSGSTPLSTISFSYSINGSAPITELFPFTLNAGQEYTYYFSTPANLATPGTYQIQISASVSGDADLLNNSETYTVHSLAQINTFPFVEDFNAGNSNYFYIDTNLYSTGSIVTTGSNSMICLEGSLLNLNPVWIGSSSNTSSAQAWQINTLHHASLSSCQIDATALSSLELFFDFKQYYRSGPKFSWFRVLVNGTPIADVNNVIEFNPVTSNSDDFVELHYDLSPYAGTVFSLEFQGANKYNQSLFPGNAAFIDNIILREIPPPDLAVIEIVSPVSGCLSPIPQPISVLIANLGGTAFTGFQITSSINGMDDTETYLGTILPEDTILYTFLSSTEFIASTSISIEISVQDSNPANDSLAANIQIYPLPSLSFAGLGTIACIYEQPVTILTTPQGGILSGDGVDNGVFTPLDAGFGSHEISYSYTEPVHSCTNTITQDIEVIGDIVSFDGFTPPQDSIGVYLRVYYNSFYVSQQSWEILDASGQVIIPIGSGGSVNGYSFNDTIYLAPGTYTFVAHDLLGNGWNNSWYWVLPFVGTETGKVFYSVPAGQTLYSQSTTFIVGENPTYCGSDNPVQLTGNPTGGLFSGPGIQGNYFFPSLAGPGDHTITYTYQGGQCLGSHEKVVTVLSSNSADLGPDFTVCSQLSAQLNLLNPGTGSSYVWSNGSTSSQIYISQSGTYSVTLTSTNGCQDSDTISVTFSQNPQFSFGPDLTACANEQVNIVANFVADSYLWNTGETTASINVTTAGTYTLTVTLNSCSTSDAIAVNYINPQLQIQTPQTFCEGTSIELDAGSGFVTFWWSTAATTSTIEVMESGNYTLTATDVNGCSATQTVVVNEIALPEIDLGPDQELTNLLILNLGNSYSSILWSDNSTSPIHAFDPNILGIGVYTYWAQVSNLEGCSNSDTVVFTVSQLYAEQELELTAGWSIFSLYVSPADLNIASILQPVQSQIIIVKNGSGNVYWPSNNVNAIGNVTTGAGYQLFMAEDQLLTVEGAVIQPENSPITIPTGWSYLGYLRTTAASIAQLLSPIVSNIVIVKDGEGLVYWPSFGYNGIGNMNPGQGYQIKLTSGTTLLYPANTTTLQKELYPTQKPVWYMNRQSSEHTMTLGIPSEAWEILPSVNAEIGIFTQYGALVGSSVFSGGFTVISINGNGLFESGYLNPDESYILKVKMPEGSEMIAESLVFSLGDGKYQANDIEIVKRVGLTQAAKQSILYPNPAQDELIISIQSDANVTAIVSLYDQTVRMVREDFSMQLGKGENQVVINISELPAGAYFLKIYANNVIETHSFVKSNEK